MNGNIIVTEPASEIKALAREGLRGKWEMALFAGLIYSVITLVPSTFIGSFLSFIPFAGTIYTYVVVAPLQLGFIMFAFRIFRNINTSPGEMFYGFEHIAKAIALRFIMGLFVLLWSLLFIIPGIVASYRYSMATYILAENPEKDIMQCIEESKWLMDGNKAKLFCLRFSFAGWFFLWVFVLTVAMILTGAVLAPAVYYSGSYLGATTLVAELVIIGLLVVGNSLWHPYVTMSEVAFFEILTGKVNVRPAQGGYPGGWQNPGGPNPGGWNNQNPGGWQNQSGQNPNGWNNQNPGGWQNQSGQNPNGWNNQNPGGWQNQNGQNPNGWNNQNPGGWQNQNGQNQNPPNPFEPVAQPDGEAPQHYGFREDGSANTGEVIEPESSVTEPPVSEPSLTEPSLTEPSLTEPSLSEPPAADSAQNASTEESGRENQDPEQ